MASGSIKSTKRNYARPTNAPSGTATTSANSTTVAITLTPSTLGPVATSYVVTGVRTSGGSVSASGTLNSAGGNVVFPVGGTHSISVRGVNYNGQGTGGTIATSVAVPFTYTQ